MKRIVDAIGEFLKLEAAGGILLGAAALLAMLLANSPAAHLYDALFDTPVEVRVGALHIAKPFLLWINDGLMAVFFFLIGLEIKREVLEGELSSPAQIVLPAIAAAAGMAAPALVYLWFNAGDPTAANGWAIPTATDIAFAVGVLALLGSRISGGLKMFLLTLAILDDLGAIVIIATFYTDNLALASLAVAGVALLLLAALNLGGVRSPPAYLLVGLVMWVAVLKSGVHATLAGVALAMFIPLRTDATAEEEEPPLRQLERQLHPVVAYAILPLFAFANSGVSLAGISWAAFSHPVPAGIAVGLVAGKTFGVFAAVLAAVRFGVARLPEGANWPQMFGASALCGIGFTMSLFISGLAFEEDAVRIVSESRIGILSGSLLAGLIGYLVLRFSPHPGARRET